MDLMSAAALASPLGFVVRGLIAPWYVVPWLPVRDRADALAPLIWVHAAASGVTWLILTFYVPLLWVSLGLIVWQLVARRGEPLIERPYARLSRDLSIEVRR
jgi:hypothetical protein